MKGNFPTPEREVRFIGITTNMGGNFTCWVRLYDIGKVISWSFICSIDNANLNLITDYPLNIIIKDNIITVSKYITYTQINGHQHNNCELGIPG